MTFLDLLRGLAYGGVELTARDGGLDIEAPDLAVVTLTIAAGLVEHRSALLRLLEPAALRARFRVPPDQPIGPGLAVVMLWVARERAAFTRDEWRAWLAAKTAYIDAGTGRCAADLLAIEDVVRARPQATAISPSVRQAA